MSRKNNYGNFKEIFLSKSLPHIPLVPEFWQFSGIGKKLKKKKTIEEKKLHQHDY